MIWVEDKYLNMLNLPGIRLVRNQPDLVYNTMCVVCGDHPSGRKKKAYIYQKADHLVYHCHLCGYHKRFAYFLKEYDNHLYNEMTYEKMLMEGKEIRGPKEPEKIILPSTDLHAVLAKRSGRYQMDTWFDRCSMLPEKNPIVKYLRYRCIPEILWDELWYVDDTADLMVVDPQHKLDGGPRILFPAFHDDGTLSAVTGRAIYEEYLRYIELKVVKERPIVFGLDRCDFTKRYFVTEGPLDRLFLPNSIAVGGSNLKKIAGIIPKDNGVLVFDNQPRTKEIVSLMTECIEDGFTLVIWPIGMLEKDINDLVRAGKDPLPIIETHIARGLSAHIQLQQWRRC